MKSGLALLMLLWTCLVNASDWVQLDHTSVRLSSEYQAIDVKEPFWVLLEFKIKPGWHTYWLNPGDSGTAPKLQWNLPQGFKASKIHWLPPHRIPAGPFINYGYSNNAYHLVKITPEVGSSSGEKPPFVQIELHASWLVCQQECVPEKADFSLTLPVKDDNQISDEFDKINTLVGKTELATLPAKAIEAEENVTVAFDKSLSGSVYFFPEQKGVIEPSATQELSTDKGVSQLSMLSGTIEPKFPLLGILQIKTAEKEKYYRLTVKESPSLHSDEEVTFLPLMLLFALLGGLILNLMPCVFPVLSLKILALKSSSNKRMQGVMYTLGVVTTFSLIALLMIILQAMGTKVGWGFQMQSPLFIISLIYLFTLVALNLFGFFEIPFSLQTNLKWQNRHQLLYAFSTGVLACIVATPCSAPFMATAVGVALSTNVFAALLIFVFLGLGLALPYLLICFIPQFAALLPKPGQWMETLKQLLAFPMLISVVWLLWVLGQQIPFDGVALILMSLCFVLFTFWLWQRVEKFNAKLLSLLIGLSLVMYPLYWLGSNNMLSREVPMQSNAFSQQKLDELIKAKEKVFVYATAAWCITCKLNEKVALNTDAVQQAFSREGVTVLKADWTNQDKTIFNYLKSFGRAGVPLYVYYAPGKKPKVLPQLLTPGIIIDAIKTTAS